MQCCAQCRVVYYCSKPCQVAAWKGGHKSICKKWCDADTALERALEDEAAGAATKPTSLPRSEDELRALCDRGDALLRRANMLLGERKLHEAAGMLDQALGFFPGYTPAACLKGLILCMQGRLDEGIASMEAGKRFDDEYKVAYGRPLALPHSSGFYNLGKAYLERGGPGDDERAVQTLRENTAREPTHVATYQMLGTALCQAGEVQEGEAMHEMALSLDPANQEACFNVAQHCARRGDMGRAKELLERCGANDQMAQMMLHRMAMLNAGK